MTRDEFVRYVLDGGKGVASKKEAKAAKAVTDALPDGFETKFGAPVVPAVAEAVAGPEKLFAEKLLRGCGFGEAETLDRARVILGDNPAAKYLSEKVLYWQKDTERPYQTLLFETDQKWTEIAREPFFKTKHSAHLDLLEDALTRLVQSALEGFQRGGEGRTADVKRGQQNETLCVISLVDDRDPADATRLVCLGTVNAVTGSLEVFFLRESCRSWEKQLREEYLGALYERQFKKLTSSKWQEAFTTEEERKLARDLVKECEGGGITEKKLANRVIGLLDEIAKGFGLRKKAGEDHRLTLTKLPEDHDIGADPDDAGGVNPFAGMSVRDEKRRLLGYIVYCLTKKADVDALRARLKEHNRFHNVLVVYPDKAQASFELWQGRDSLEGRLTKQGAKFAGEAQVISLLSRFFVVSRAKVKNPVELADELASRAKYLRRLAEKQLAKEKSKGHLRDLFKAFKEALIHDMTEESFADAFAQTLTYGLLTARWLSRDEIEEKGERFTRETALKHLPSTSPFLREFFQQALDATFAPNLIWLLEDIAELLDRVNINEVFGVGNQGADSSTDPVIHFYEPFLAAYDPEQRQKRGVYYTPRPVVSNIVLGVDEMLRTQLGVADGLASTISWEEMLRMHPGLVKPASVAPNDPFVRVLDPATGTGTFLVMCIEVIARTVKEAAKANLKADDIEDQAVLQVWRKYVKEHLMPRLCGYEIMIAPYAIAHLKIGLKLRETGALLEPADHLHVFLTNGLEPAVDFSGSFAFDVPALAAEAKAVNTIKRAACFTVVVGNPPYSLLSANLEPAHRKLVERYKSIDGVKIVERGALQMEKILNDDYVKFIALAEQSILKSGIGVVGLVTNHAFLDNPTMRGLRASMLRSFSMLRFIELGGSAKKAKNIANDQNVFDIQQGVAISLLARRQSAAAAGADLGATYYGRLEGSRQSKYEALRTASSELAATALQPEAPLFLFVPSQKLLWNEYKEYVAIDEMFPLHSIGCFTSKDHVVISHSAKRLEKNAISFRDSDETDAELCRKLDINAKKAWNVSRSRAQIRELNDVDIRRNIRLFPHRPFDEKFVFYHRSLVWSMAWPVNRNMLAEDSLAIVTSRQLAAPPWKHVFCSNTIVEMFYISNKTKEGNHVFPLYVSGESDPGAGGQGSLNLAAKRQANVSPQIVEHWSKLLRLQWVDNGRGDATTSWGPQTLFDYVYALLHSAEYRERYEEFLSRDFARVPCPSSPALLKQISTTGRALVEAHLPATGSRTRPGASKVVFHGGANARVERGFPRHEGDKVFVSPKAWFSGVDGEVWKWTVGVYQVCKKWLAERPDSTISSDDVERFQALVDVIETTQLLSATVDETVAKFGGWPKAFAQTSGSAL